MKLFVNFLTAFRIAVAFAIIPTLMLNLYWATFIIFVVAALSDLFDGFFARKYKVTSKLGGVMDHIGDKLLVVIAFVLLGVIMPVWFVIIPIVIMIAREIYISGLREFLGTQKMEMPVPSSYFSMGKIKTALQMISISIFLLMFSIGASVSVANISHAVILWMRVLPPIAIICLWLALLASLWSATEYTFTFVEKLKKLR